MHGGASYILKGHGQIDPVWVQGCFQLFKERSVNIRKLLLLKNGQPERFAMLEIQFVVSPEDTQFLSALQERLATQSWTEQSVLPL